MSIFAPAAGALEMALTLRIVGRVAAVRGLTVLVDDLPLPIGSLVSICSSGKDGLLGEVVGLASGQSIVFVLGQTSGIRAGEAVTGCETAQTAPVGRGLLGRIVDGLGRPIDGGPPPVEMHRYPLSPDPIPSMQRAPVKQQLLTGVRVIDLMTPMGKGQRMGIFAGPGVGKSMLMGNIARRASCDVNIIALIGERGREVKDFIENNLGKEGLAKSVVVVATGDEPPLLRIRAAKLACAAAEYFRDQSLNVLLMMDSVTRFAHAQRQVGLSAGEPPTTKGYTPSVFSSMGLLLERAGIIQANPTGKGDAHHGGGGSITGLYTVLVEGDDMTEPVADAARGILDGHIILSRRLAQKGHFPAVDVLDSVSRVAEEVTDERAGRSRRQMIKLLAAHRDVEDLVQIGAFARGANPTADVAIDANAAILELLRQGKADTLGHEQALARFHKIADESSQSIERATKPRARQP